MMETPSAVPSMGTRRVVFLPAVADITKITKVEMATGKNLSCYLTRAGGWNPGGDQGTIKDDRLCSIQDFEQPGTESRTLEVQYVFNLGTPAEDEARLALEKGTRGVIVHLMQVDEDSETFETGDWYEAAPVVAGMQMVQAVEDNAVDRIKQKLFVTGPWVDFKQLV